MRSQYEEFGTTSGVATGQTLQEAITEADKSDSETWDDRLANRKQHHATRIIGLRGKMHNLERERIESYDNATERILREVEERQTIKVKHG